MTSTVDAAAPRHAGAQWVRCSLQVNPYAYHEVNCPSSLPPGGEDTYNAEVVAALKATGVGLVAITDHWRAARRESLRTVCQAAGITALPGFEATTSEDVHVLVLFDPTAQVGELNRRIAECGIPYINGESVPCNLTITELLTRVRGWDAIAIPAHATGPSGLLRALSGAARAHAMKSSDLFAVAFGGDEPDAGQRAILYGTAAEYERAQPVAVLQAADVHGPQWVTKPASTCWVRLSSRSAAGLARAVRSPRTRVRNESPEADAHARLVELTVEGGFLDGLSLPLNDELNVLIGGRGSGKSTVLECIRFALDLPALTQRGQEQHDAVVDQVLGTATKVTVIVECGHPTPGHFRIERTQGGPSRVIDQAGQQHSSHPADVLPGVEIYGQRELADVADDKARQADLLRSLLDQYAIPQPAELGRSLVSNRETLARTDQEMAALDESLAELPKVQERLDRLGGAGVAERLSQQSQLERQDRVLETATERATEARGALTLLGEMATVDAFFAAPPALADLPDHDVLAAVQPALTALADALSGAREQAAAALTLYETAIASARDRLSVATADRRAALRAQLRALSAEAINGREYLALERRIANGKTLRQSRERFLLERKELESRRQQLVKEQEDAVAKDARRLEGKAKEVTGRLSGLLRIDVAAKPDTSTIKWVLEQHTRGRLVEVVQAVESRAVTGLQLAGAGRMGLTALQGLLVTSSAAVNSVAQAGEPLWRALEEIPRIIEPTIDLNIGTREHP